MSRAGALVRRGAALALLPLSVIPFLGVAPMLTRSHEHFERRQAVTAMAPSVPSSGLGAADSDPLRPFAAGQETTSKR